MLMQMQMMNMRGLQATDKEYDFVVTLRDSTKKEVTSAIYTDSVSRKRFIILVDKKFNKSDTNRYKKIFPAQTLNLTCVLIPRDDDNNVPGNYLQGKPADTCWMFKAFKGRLTAYSYTINDGPFDTSMITGIQLNDGPILKFTKENLKTMVGHDAKVLELIEDGKDIRAIKRFNRDSEKDGNK